MFVFFVLTFLATAWAQGQELTIGYPTRVSADSNGCVTHVMVPPGTKILRIMVDRCVFCLSSILRGDVQVFAGRGDTVSKTNIGKVTIGDARDIMLTIQPPRSLIAQKWWILVTSSIESDVLVSAVIYDITRKPRIPVQIGTPSGTVAVEFGSSEIYRLSLPKNQATTVTVDVDASWILGVGETYDIFATIFDDRKIDSLLADLTWARAAQFVNSIAAALRSGDLSSVVPKLMSPDATTNDVAFKTNQIGTGKVTFDVPASKQAPLVYIAVVPKGGLPWSGALSSFKVTVSTTQIAADKSGIDAGACTPGPAKKKRAIEQVGDECQFKTCGDCVAADGCHYCHGAGAVNDDSACRAMTSSCPAESEALTGAAAVDTCNRCVTATTEAECPAEGCTFCTELSAGDISQGCQEAWLCQEITESTATVADSPTTASANANASTAANGETTTKSSSNTNKLSLMMILSGVMLIVQ